MIVEEYVHTLNVCQKRIDALHVTLQFFNKLGAEHVAICLADEAIDNQLVIRLSFGMKEASNKIISSSGMGICGVIESYQKARVISAEEGFTPSDIEKSLGLIGMSYLPLYQGENHIGAIMASLEISQLVNAIQIANALAGYIDAHPIQQSHIESELKEGSLAATFSDLTAAFNQMNSAKDIYELSDITMKYTLELTHSEFGFVGYIDPKNGFLTCPTLTKEIFPESKIEGKTLVFEKAGGLGGIVLDTNRSLVANDPMNHPGSVGTPPGHLPIRKFMGVPCMIGDRKVGMIALANKLIDYTKADLDVIENFAALYAARVSAFFEQEALIVSRDKLYQLYNDSSSLFYTLYPDGKIEDLNESARTLFGDVDHIKMFLDSHQMNLLKDQMESRSFSQNIELKIDIHKEPRWFVHSIRPYYDYRGYIRHYYCTLLDITSLKQQESELQLQSYILNTVTDSIFVHQLDGTILYANETAYKSRGYEKEDLLNMKMQDLDYHDGKLGDAIYEENMQNIMEQMKTKGEARFEVSHRAKDGRIIPMEVHTKVIQNTEGTYVAGIARDITERQEIQRKLAESEEKYRYLVENSQIGIFTSKIAGDILYVNDACVAIFGFDDKNDLTIQKASDLYKNPMDRDRLISTLRKNGKVETMELEILTKQGNFRTVLLNANIEKDTLSGTMMDITEMKKAQAEIERLSNALEQIDDMVSITNRAGIFNYVNKAFIKHTGFTRDELIGKKPAILKSGEHNLDFYKQMWKQILSGNVFRGLVVNRKKDGEKYFEEKTITPLKNERGEIISFISTGKDITERIEMQQQLEQLATTDHLTGIYNRHKFEELFEKELEREKRYKFDLSLIMFDIDYFKNVNDTFGHDIGDRVLKRVVQIVSENIRIVDIFARWGGEEFLILCPNTEEAQAVSLAEKLRKEIETKSFEGVDHITCSFGVTSYKVAETKESFIKRVDNALYKAKENGRNRTESM